MEDDMSADAPDIRAEARELRQASAVTQAVPGERPDPGRGPARKNADSTRAEGRIGLWQVTALRVGAGILLLAIWQVGAKLFAPSYIATPLGAIGAIPGVLGDSSFWGGTGATLFAIVEGLAIAVVVGTVVGLAMGRLPDLNRVLGMYVGAFYAIPLIAIVPLLTVWFGYTPQARLAMIVLEAVLPIIYNVAEGSRQVSAVYLDVTRIHHVRWWRVWGGVVFPNAMPYVLAGIDLAIGRAVIGAVVAEFITAINGLGYYIIFNVRSFHEDQGVVALVVIVIFALVVRALVNLTVARVMPWYRPAKEA
jgi:ABC-type nitrate/sulfonate/bicarbonate transport system permease component